MACHGCLPWAESCQVLTDQLFATAVASRRMSGIGIIRHLLVALRRHRRRILRAGDAAGAELITLDVVLGAIRLASVDGQVLRHGMVLLA